MPRRSLTSVALMSALIGAAPAFAQEAEPADAPGAPEPPVAEEGSPGVRMRLRRLEQLIASQQRRIAELEARDAERSSPREAPEVAPTSPESEAEWRFGTFFIESADGDARLQVTFIGTAHALYAEDEDAVSDSFELRYVRPGLRGRFARFVEYQFDFEFGRTSDADLRAAFVNLRAWDAVQLRIGQQLYPYSFERRIPIARLLHPERPIAIFNQVTPFELGIALHGDLFDGLLNYELGVFNGNGANTSRDEDDDKDIAASLEIRPVSGLRIGLSGIHSPELRGRGAPIDLRTVGNQVTRFVDVLDARVRHQGRRLRGALSLEWRAGPFRLLAEGFWDRREDLALVPTAANPTRARIDLDIRSWFLDASYILTGEADSAGRLVPSDPVQAREGGVTGWGAWQLAGRVEGVHTEQEAFSKGFAVGADAMISGTGTVNWVPVEHLLLALSYTRSEFSRAPRDADGRRVNHADSVIARLTLDF